MDVIKVIACLYIDFEKAYDKVIQTELSNVLCKFGIEVCFSESSKRRSKKEEQNT